MARNISAENQTALEQRELYPRDFLSLWPRNRETGDPVFVGFWSDFPGISALVVDPDSGEEVEREFIGAGSSLINISDIPAIAAVQVQTVQIILSQLDATVTQAVREYDPRQCRVEIHRGLFHPGGRVMVSAAECRLVGFIDTMEIKTPKEGEGGWVQLTAVSHTREMTRANPDTRSHESQILRNAGDMFLKDAGTVGDWEFFWGRAGGKLDTDKSEGNEGKNPSKNPVRGRP